MTQTTPAPSANRPPMPPWVGIIGCGVLLVLATCALCAALVLSWLGVGMPAVAPGSLAGRILFMSGEYPDFFLYVMNADGSQSTRVGDQPGDYAPAWSRDGKKIAFVDFGGKQEYQFYIHTMDTDGSQRSGRLAEGSLPAWSPDGKLIAFSSIAGDIRVMDADGKNNRSLYAASAPGAAPAWSPDGSRIAFQAQVNGRNEIFVVDADGSHPTRLTTNGGNNPDWSPDGARIAYDWDGIYIIDANGSNSVRIKGGIFDTDPSWSPDGKHIAFIGWVQGQTRICVIDAGGGNLRYIENGLAGGMSTPIWAP